MRRALRMPAAPAAKRAASPLAGGGAPSRPVPVARPWKGSTHHV